MTNEENMQIWKKAFTHISYDERTNYEALEYFGDKELESAFTRWLYNKNPDYTEEEMTSDNLIRKEDG